MGSFDHIEALRTMVSTFASLSLQILVSSITQLKCTMTIFVLVGKHRHHIYMSGFYVFVWFPCEQTLKIIYNDCEGGRFQRESALWKVWTKKQTSFKKWFSLRKKLQLKKHKIDNIVKKKNFPVLILLDNSKVP